MNTRTTVKRMTLNREGSPLCKWAGRTMMKKIQRKSVSGVVGSQTWRQLVNAIYFDMFFSVSAMAAFILSFQRRKCYRLWCWQVTSSTLPLPVISILIIDFYLIWINLFCRPFRQKKSVKCSRWKKIIWKMCIISIKWCFTSLKTRSSKMNVASVIKQSS